MFALPKKIATAASLLAINSGQFDVFGSNINNNNNDEWHEGNQLLIQQNQNATQGAAQ